MARIVPTLDFVTLLPTKPSLSNFLLMLRKVYTNLALTLNGKIGFGDGTNFDNISGTWANTTAPAAPNTDFTITHNLGRVPVGYWVMQKDRACDVYTGSVAATVTQLTLRATVASAVLRLFIVGILLFFTSIAQAQTTTVTLQVTDAGGQAWNFGTWSVVLVSKQGAVPFGPPFNIPGSGPVPNQFQTGSFDGTGTATVIVTPNASIVPTQSQWRFTVCPQATSPCFDQAFVIAGATQSVSPTPPAISVSCGAATKAYSDSEVICQQGGFYYRLPTNTLRLCTASTPANTCTTWIDTGQGAAAAAGSPPQAQVNDPGNPGHFGGTPCQSFPSLTVGPVNNDCDWHSKGPNPYVDITRFGARVCNFNLAPCAAGITASINSGSATATLSSASTFVNGDGVVIYGAGSASGLTTPSAPTVTNVLAQMGTGTDLTATSAAGATTKCYKIIARTTAGGYTPASAETCTTTGQSTLGVVTVNLSSCSRSVITVTCTTSSATPLLVGNPNSSEVYIGGSISDSSFRGWRPVNSAADSTHFTFIDSAINTTYPGATTGSTGGTATFFTANHLSWTAVANAWLYYIYGGASGAETLIGVSRPQNIAGSMTFTTWDDFTNLMGNYTFPPWIPTTPPTVGANNNLSTTILSGAGTTTITLNANAGATVSGAGTRLDAGPAMVAAAAVAVRGAGELFIPGTSGGAGQFVINNYCDLTPYNLAVAQSGTLVLHETLALAGNGLRYTGDRSTASGAALGGGGSTWGNFPQILVAEAVPGMYVNSGFSYSIEGINFQSLVNNGVLLTLIEFGFNGFFKDDNWTTGTNPTDLMGFGLILRGIAGQSVAGIAMDKVTFGSGLNGDGASHNTPFFCNDCGDVTIRDAYSIHSGFIFAANASGGDFEIDQDHYNGGFTPFVSAIGGGSTNTVALGLPGQPIIMDTVGHPCISVFSGNWEVTNNTCFDSGYIFGSPSITGIVAGIAGIGAISGGGAAFNNSLITTLQEVTSISGVRQIIDNVTGPGGMSVGPNDNFFVQDVPAPSAPTCAVIAGGSMAIQGYTFKTVAVWQNGQEGSASPASSTCTTTTGNQAITVSWNVTPGGPKGYDLLVSNNGGASYITVSCSTPLTTTTSITVSSSVFCGQSYAGVPLGGPTMLLPGTQGMAAPAYVTPSTSTPGFTTTASAPVLTANRTTNWPDTSGTIVVTSYQNSVYDNFNRANGALSGTWTQQASDTVNISANQVVDSGTAGAQAFWNANSFTAPQFAQATITAFGGNSAGVELLASATGGSKNYYACIENTTNMFIQRLQNGVFTSLATGGGAGSIGDVVRAEITIPGVITCFRNGTAVLTFTDTALTTGSPGVNVFNGGSVDNWSGGVLHPSAQLDMEQDWSSTAPQHFIGPVTIGPTNPVAGTLAANTLYTPNLVVNGTPFGPVYTTISASTNANITNTTMTTAGANGNTYRFGFYFNETVAGTGCTTNTTVVVTLTYTDPNLGVVTNISIPSWTGTIVNNGNLGTLNQVLPTYVRAKASTAVQYSVAYTAGTCTTTPSYQVFPILEILN